MITNLKKLLAFKPKKLVPLLVAEHKFQYDSWLTLYSSDTFLEIENRLLTQKNSDEFAVRGFCIPCGKNVNFHVDLCFGGTKEAGIRAPNWRERMVCPSCSMNNRQRLVASLVKDVLQRSRCKKIYFMEQITPIYQWALKQFSNHVILGSEYLGPKFIGGNEYHGIRHEDVENLSFSDCEIDLIISNDVFEHVPDPSKAYRECLRVLKPGGHMLFTIPFYAERSTTISRAAIINDEVVHYLESQYHGNPVSEKGSLVFSDFGWDVLNLLRSEGFSKAAIQIYSSERYGHLGPPQLVFNCSKALID